MARKSIRKPVGERRALAGIRVLDLTQAANGPFSMLILALLGAEIIKIEPLAGDQHRRSFTKTEGVDGYSFVLMNHSKKGVTLNLKNDMGKEMFKEMVKKADVVAENFTLGTMERLGLGYDVLKELNPRIIYLSSKGYGYNGPYKDYPAYDTSIQAMSGGMSVNGYPGSPPCKMGPAVPDWATACYNAIGILAALRLRDITGQGRMIETSMQEAAVSFVNDWLQMYLEFGWVPVPLGNNPYRPRPDLEMPRGIYQCTDGWVFISPGLQDAEWANLLKVTGREELLKDKRFGDRIGRCEQSAEIDKMLDQWVKGKTKKQAMDIMCRGGVTAGAVLNMDEVVADPHLNERKFFVEMDHPKKGQVKVFGLPIKMSDSPTSPVALPPLLGQHNEEVYSSLLGYSKKEIAGLKEQGII